MSLADILARKKLLASEPASQKEPVNSPPLTIKPLTIKPSIIEENIEENIDYKVIDTEKYLPSYERNEYFFSVYSLLIKYPYLLYGETALFSFLLGDNIYVLNTFPILEAEKLFEKYMEKNPPKKAHDLHKLYVAICRICLNIPGYYQKEVEDIISGKIPLD